MPKSRVQRLDRLLFDLIMSFWFSFIKIIFAGILNRSWTDFKEYTKTEVNLSSKKVQIEFESRLNWVRIEFESSSNWVQIKFESNLNLSLIRVWIEFKSSCSYIAWSSLSEIYILVVLKELRKNWVQIGFELSSNRVSNLNRIRINLDSWKHYKPWLFGLLWEKDLVVLEVLRFLWQFHRRLVKIWNVHLATCSYQRHLNDLKM